MRVVLIVLTLIFSSHTFSQSLKVSSLSSESSKVSIVKGQLLDGASENQPLAFATIKISDTNEELTTDENGNFSIRLTPNNYTFTFSFIGYKNLVENIQVTSKSEIFLTKILSALTYNPILKAKLKRK